MKKLIIYLIYIYKIKLGFIFILANLDLILS